MLLISILFYSLNHNKLVHKQFNLNFVLHSEQNVASIALYIDAFNLHARHKENTWVNVVKRKVIEKIFTDPPTGSNIEEKLNI